MKAIDLLQPWEKTPEGGVRFLTESNDQDVAWVMTHSGQIPTEIEEVFNSLRQAKLVDTEDGGLKAIWPKNFAPEPYSGDAGDETEEPNG